VEGIRRAIIKPPLAAKIMKCNPQAIREGMKDGTYTFGRYTPKEMRRKANGKYDIFVPKFEAYIGRQLTDYELSQGR